MTFTRISQKVIIVIVFILGAALVNTFFTTHFYAARDIELTVFNLDKAIIILGSILLGPFWGAIVGSGEYIISFFIKSGSINNIFVPLVIISAIGGFAPAFIFRFLKSKLHRLLNIFIAVSVSQLYISVLIMSFLMSIHYSIDFKTILTDRLSAQAISIPAISFILLMTMIFIEKMQSCFAGKININKILLRLCSLKATPKKINNQLSAKKKMISLRNLLSISMDGLWSLSYPDMNLIHISPSVEKIYGRSVQEFIDIPNLWYSIVHPDDQHLLDKSMTQLITKGLTHRECRVIRPDGTTIRVRETLKMIYDENVKTFTICGIATDITDSKANEELVLYSKFHDILTGLYNRNHFSENEEAIKRFSAASVIITDINGLKLINDTYGYETGDLLLKEYAKILKQTFEKDDLIYRWGGDEFLIITKKTSESKSWKLCNRLIKKCENTRLKNIPLSISIGISSKKHNEPISKTLIRAEDLMYRNKLNESKSSKSLIMKTLIQTLSEKSYETHEHIERMITIGHIFVKKLQLCPNEISRLDTLIMLHDVGKINIDSRILLKGTRLSDKEWKEIMKHPEIGYRITHATEEFAYIAEDILSHHERWDGKGYPRGLRHTEIPYLSRIISIIDSFDVMYNGRPYKQKMSLNAITKEIRYRSGKQFDPRLAEEFVNCLREDSFGFRYTNNNGNKPQRLLFL